MRFCPRAACMLFFPRAVDSKSSASAVGSSMLFYVCCRPAAVQRGEGMVPSVGAYFLAPLDSATDHREGSFAGRCCDHFLEATHKHIFHPDGLHGIQVDGVRLICRG